VKVRKRPELLIHGRYSPCLIQKHIGTLWKICEVEKSLDKEYKMNMKVYIAASFPRMEEAQNLGLKLEAMGFEITSYWHQGGETASEYHSGVRALRDYLAVERSELFIELVGDLHKSRGGRHCELGLALAWNKKIMLVGSIDDCIFTNLPYLPRFESVEALLARLT
jgi:hypothetical protein